MKKIIYLLLLTILFANDEFEGILKADIDRDGKQESISWHKFAANESGSFYQLIVFDDSGAILWRGPLKADESNPLIFMALHYGISIPELIADIDQDSSLELIAPHLQSDVSPTTYRILRWTGNGFEKLPSYALMLASSSSNTLRWKKVDKYYGTWVSGFKMKDGKILADITQLNEEGSYKSGVADISFTPKGAAINRWVEPLHTP